MTKAKVFMNGRSQAIRLPKDFRVKGKEVYLERSEAGFMVSEQDPWDLFLEGCQEITADSIPERKQPRLEKRSPMG